MKNAILQRYKSIGYKPINCKLCCDGCGNYTEVLEYGGMTESGYESDYVNCLNCLEKKHPELISTNPL